MFEGLNEEQLPSALEALLFVTSEPVNAINLAEMLEVEVVEVMQALLTLQQKYQENESGIQLFEVAGGWRLYTHPAYNNLLEEYVLSWDTRRMSKAALEVLAIIAYGQPITRADISAVRGVNSDSSLNTLLERGLVREAGNADSPGNPLLYATTRSFLEHFGLRAVSDLPDLEDFAPDDEVAKLIKEQLGVVLEHAEGSYEATGADDLDLDEVRQEAEEIEDMPSLFGVVEKVDFESLNFNTDDE